VTCAKKTINRGKIIASFAMGTRRLYDFIDNNPMVEFYESDYVNNPIVISQHEKMISINQALEIDLTGQVCSDSLGYRFYSGLGGQADFMRGANLSKGGKAITVIPSTAKNGRISRIRPLLTEGAGIVLTRGDVNYVVTEYGVALLKGRTIKERALSLINIAHPTRKTSKKSDSERRVKGFVTSDKTFGCYNETAFVLFAFKRFCSQALLWLLKSYAFETYLAVCYC